MKIFKYGIFILALLIISCTPSLKSVYDDTVPIEQSAWISTANAGTIVSINGVTVNWSGNWTDSFRQIPAGETLLEWNVSSDGYTGRGFYFMYDFKKGMQYYFIAREVGGVFGFNVYELPIGEKSNFIGSQEEFVEFVPFLNASRGILLTTENSIDK